MIIATPDMFLLSNSSEPRICGGELGGCGKPVNLDNDAAVHEYLLTGIEVAMQQSTHHLIPVFDETGQVLCKGFPMVARHFGSMSLRDIRAYKLEDPDLAIHDAYAVAYIDLGRFAAYRDHLVATAVEATVEVVPPPHAVEGRLAALFRVAASYIL